MGDANELDLPDEEVYEDNMLLCIPVYSNFKVNQVTSVLLCLRD